MPYKLETSKKSIYYRKGRTQPISEIVIHHWGAEGKTTFDRLVTWLSRPDQKDTSPHYVAERGRVARLVDETDTAYHAGRVANPKSIGIECRPEATSADYETVAELISDIWKRHGKLEIKAHKDYMATGCPGKWDLAKLKTMAEEFYAPKQASGTGATAGGSNMTKVYRIQVGSFPTRAQAETLLRQVRMSFPQAIIAEAEVNLTPTIDYVRIAREVLSGKWGNDPERSVKLKASGYDPLRVQAEVNKLLKG